LGRGPGAFDRERFRPSHDGGGGGAGDGAATFNLPSLGGRLLACRENMNGAGAEGRITLAGSGITGTTLDATGGAQNVVLATAEIPSHTHATV
jgi:microcystin-dependent protein